MFINDDLHFQIDSRQNKGKFIINAGKTMKHTAKYDNTISTMSGPLFPCAWNGILTSQLIPLPYMLLGVLDYDIMVNVAISAMGSMRQR